MFMEKYVNDIFDERVLVELEKRPDQLMMSTINSVGRNISTELRGLGFLPKGKREKNLVLMDTPEKILGRDWALSRPVKKEGEKQDLNLFTIYVNHEREVGYVDFLQQIRTQRGDYCIFFP